VNLTSTILANIKGFPTLTDSNKASSSACF